MVKNSLTDYLKEELPKTVAVARIDADETSLRNALTHSELDLSRLAELYRQQKGIFDIYTDARDIDKGYVEQYMKGLKQFRKIPYKMMGGSNLLDKILNKSQEIDKHNGQFFSGVPMIVGSICGCLASVCYFASLKIGDGLHPLFLGIATSSFELPALSYLFFYSNAGELQKDKPVFKNGAARNYLTGLNKFYNVAQKMEREVEDINTLSGSQRTRFIEKYGKMRVKKEKISLNGLSKDEREAIILENGAKEIEERMNHAREYVQETKKSIYSILNNAGIPVNELTDYVSQGERFYDEQIAPQQKIEAEVNHAIRMQEVAPTLEQVREEVARKKMVPGQKISQ